MNSVIRPSLIKPYFDNLVEEICHMVIKSVEAVFEKLGLEALICCFAGICHSNYLLDILSIE